MDPESLPEGGTKKRGLTLLGHFSVPILSVIAMSLFPCLVMFARNAENAVSAATMLPFFIVFLVSGTLALLLALAHTRNLSCSAVFADAVLLVVINFTLAATKISEHWEDFDPWMLHMVCGLALEGLLMLFIRKKPDLTALCGIIALSLTAVMLVNLGIAVPTLLENRRLLTAAEDREEMPLETFAEDAEKRNVYIFLFDEYGGYENTLHYYDFKNKAFYTGLEDRGFSVSRSSHNTEALYTDVLIPNIMNMDYVMSPEKCWSLTRHYLEDPYLYRLFRANGYQINLVNQLDYLGDEDCNVLSGEQIPTSISTYLLENSIFKEWDSVREDINDIFKLDYTAHYKDGLQDVFDTGLTVADETGDQPTLTLCYYQCPHAPLVVSRHGTMLSYSNARKWYEPERYLNQLKYCSDYMTEAVDNILAEDPDAVIFLMSDHGCRYPVHMLQMGLVDDYDPYEENQWMQSVLNCVYVGGEEVDIEGLSTINTMRTVFNQVFGTDYPALEQVYDYTQFYQDEN